MRILNFGSCNIDYVYSLDHIVAPGETEPSCGLNVFAGGKGLNQSIAIARAGAKVCHAGCIGNDGQFLADLLSGDGVDTSHLRKVDAKNGHAIIQVSSNGENSIVIYPGSNAMITKEDADKVLADFSSGDILLLQNEISNVEYIVNEANKKGMRVVLNPSPIDENILKIDFSKLSYIVLNEIEAERITGCADERAALACFRRRYPELAVILTLGKRGSIYGLGDESFYQPIFCVDVKDTTAAGDTYTGYFVAELSKGKDVREAMKLASLASAISVSRSGASPSVPRMEEVVSALGVLKERPFTPADGTTKRKLIDFIDRNLASVTLESLSAALGYSAPYTGSLVRRYTGLSYTDYLVEMRMVKAAELLGATNMSVSEIISEVGYENESYFRKKFVAKYGMRPLEFRKVYRK